MTKRPIGVFLLAAACGCAAQPTDDTGMKGATSFTVRCEMGLCTSHVL